MSVNCGGPSPLGQLADIIRPDVRISRFLVFFISLRFVCVVRQLARGREFDPSKGPMPPGQEFMHPPYGMPPQMPMGPEGLIPEMQRMNLGPQMVRFAFL